MPHRHLQMGKCTEYLSVKLISATSATKYQVSRFHCFFFSLFARNEMILYVCAFVLFQNYTQKQSFYDEKSRWVVREEPENRIIDNENNKEPTIATISSQKSTLRCAMCLKSGTNIFKITLKGRFMNILHTIIAKYCSLDHFQFDIAIFSSFYSITHMKLYFRYKIISIGE